MHVDTRGSKISVATSSIIFSRLTPLFWPLLIMMLFFYLVKSLLVLSVFYKGAASSTESYQRYGPHKNCSTKFPILFEQVTNCHCFCHANNRKQHAFVLMAKKLQLQKHDALMPSMIVSPWNSSELIVLTQPGHSSWNMVSYESLSMGNYLPTHHTSSTGIIGNFTLVGQCLDFRMYHFNSTFHLINFQQNPRFKWMAHSEFRFLGSGSDKRLQSVPRSEARFKVMKQAFTEKNWGPFSFTPEVSTSAPNMLAGQPQLMLEYSLNPHRVYVVQPVNKTTGVNAVLVGCTNLTSNNDMFWKPRHMRSGTPAVLLKEQDLYLSFFHVSEKFTNQSGIKSYVMGAHTFDSHPPFALRHVSPEPITHKNFYRGQTAYKRLNYQIYPTQFIVQDDKIILSVHRNDRESWVVEMSLSGLLDSLQPVETANCNPR